MNVGKSIIVHSLGINKNIILLIRLSVMVHEKRGLCLKQLICTSFWPFCSSLLLQRKLQPVWYNSKCLMDVLRSAQCHWAGREKGNLKWTERENLIWFQLYNWSLGLEERKKRIISWVWVTWGWEQQQKKICLRIQSFHSWLKPACGNQNWWAEVRRVWI